MRGKKGLSEIIAYVLLIAIALALSVIVYGWLKGQIMKETPKCPEDLSIVILDYSCDSANKIIILKLANRGLFSIDGFIARGTDNSGKINLLNSSNGETQITFLSGNLPPSTESQVMLKYSDSLKKIAIEPFVKSNRKVILCESSILTQEVSC